MSSPKQSERDPFARSEYTPKAPTQQKFILEGPLAGSVQVFSTQETPGALRLHLPATELDHQGRLDLTPEDQLAYQQWLLATQDKQ